MSEEETALVPYQKELKALQATGKKNDFYKVGDTSQPSARVLQQWANRYEISTEIIKIHRDEKMAYAIVRGWRGKKENPDIVHDEAVEIYFDDYLADWLFKKTKYGMKAAVDDRGVPMPTEPQDKQKMAEFIFRKKMFALREAITKAQKRIYLKILSVEWRDPEEIEGEAEEMETVEETFTKKPEKKWKGKTADMIIVDEMQNLTEETIETAKEYEASKDGITPQEIQTLTQKLEDGKEKDLTTREKGILMNTLINGGTKTGKLLKKVSKSRAVVDQRDADIEMLWNMSKKTILKEIEDAKAKASQN